ncbi:unnamed protein product [Pelagomonas calceolata]|uniref:CRAL-TRIO domain-containing protein n=1 Tax=Pelagomonas calceolata TaxID=35677 RepID=A0A8J2SHL6_9STRA|nr:unnamed protein product [Pelagomonas calceolata]
MGCCASKKPAALGEDGSTPEERLERRRSTKQKLGTVVNPRVEADDDQLAKLGLALNDELEEGKPLTEQEETKLKDEIVAKLEDASVMESFDETSRVRIFRGMITNNNGTDDENVQEAIETYGTVGKWLREHPSILSEKLPKEELLNGVMNARVGGVDFQGHLVWCEQLGDIAGVVKKGLTVDEAKVLRMKTLEAIRAAQIRACETRGPRRYKNVYVMDLSKLSTMSMSSSSVRDMAKAIVTGAGSFFPETAWKLFIVNAPFIFRSAYKVISPLIHPVTRDKIKILGGKSAYLPAMQKAGIPLSALPESMGGKYPDKSIEKCIEELLAEGFPRAAREYVQQTEEVAEGEGVSLTREPSLPGEEAEAETFSPSMKILGVVGLAATAFGGAVASGAVF